MKRLAVLATIAAAGLSLAACGKTEGADNGATATDAFANDVDTGNEILTDENAFATQDLDENLGDAQTNFADDAVDANATTGNAP